MYKEENREEEKKKIQEDRKEIKVPEEEIEGKMSKDIYL